MTKMPPTNQAISVISMPCVAGGTARCSSFGGRLPPGIRAAELLSSAELRVHLAPEVPYDQRQRQERERAQDPPSLHACTYAPPHAAPRVTDGAAEAASLTAGAAPPLLLCSSSGKLVMRLLHSPPPAATRAPIAFPRALCCLRVPRPRARILWLAHDRRTRRALAVRAPAQLTRSRTAQNTLIKQRAHQPEPAPHWPHAGVQVLHG